MGLTLITQSETCQNDAWKVHKRICKAQPESVKMTPPTGPVQGIYMRGGRNVNFDSAIVTVEPGHPVWDAWKHGGVSAISQILGCPLLIHREEAERPLDVLNIAEKDNQAVTYMMINPDTGFASPRCVLFIPHVQVYGSLISRSCVGRAGGRRI